MQCHTCHIDKPATPEFFVLQVSGRLTRWCRECKKVYHRERYRREHPPKPFTAKPSAPKTKVCCRCFVEKPFTGEYFHVRRKAAYGLLGSCKPCTRKQVLQLKYKTNVEKTGQKCEICSGGHRLVYDHNHRTNEARGIICQGCNSYLSAVENPSKRKAFAAYLIKYNSWLE